LAGDYHIGVAVDAKTNILIVDDEREILESLAYDFERLGYRVFLAASAKEAIETLKKNEIDIVLSDVRMPKCDGIGLLKIITEDLSFPKTIFMSANAGIDLPEAYELGAVDLIDKPIDFDRLMKRVASIERSLRKPWAEIPSTIDKTISIAFESFQNAIRSGALQIGIGGMFLGINKDFPDLNSHIKFKLKSAKKIVAGIGKVQWVRRSHAKSLIPGIGVEVLFLSPQSRRIFKGLQEYGGQKAVIPIGDLNKATNLEIERLIFMVAHTLREPINRIAMQADFIREDRLDKELTNLYHRGIRENIAILESLIDRLNSYAVVLKHEPKIEQIHAKEIFHLAIEQLANEMEERRTIKSSVDLPDLLMDRGDISILFIEIMRYFIFENSNRPTIHITVSYQESDSCVRLYFVDERTTLSHEEIEGCLAIPETELGSSQSQSQIVKPVIGLYTCKAIVRKYRGSAAWGMTAGPIVKVELPLECIRSENSRMVAA
jgi:CheY-like chemotaxis protein